MCGGKVKVEQDGFELNVATADEVDVEIELEVENGRTEVEVELSSKTGGSVQTENKDPLTSGTSPLEAEPSWTKLRRTR
jgi:hypothetical protein